MMVLGGAAFSYERGAPVNPKPSTFKVSSAFTLLPSWGVLIDELQANPDVASAMLGRLLSPLFFLFLH